MKTNETEARVRDDVKKASSSKLEVRSGVRAGRTWRSGNKVWSDDWLAPQ